MSHWEDHAVLNVCYPIFKTFAKNFVTNAFRNVFYPRYISTKGYINWLLFFLCPVKPIYTRDKVERTFNIRATKSTKLVTMSTATSCRIQVVADLLPKPATKSTVLATVDCVAYLLPVSATVDFQQSRPCWIQLSRQCVPGFTDISRRQWHRSVWNFSWWYVSVPDRSSPLFEAVPLGAPKSKILTIRRRVFRKR